MPQNAYGEGNGRQCTRGWSAVMAPGCAGLSPDMQTSSKPGQVGREVQLAEGSLIRTNDLRV